MSRTMSGIPTSGAGDVKLDGDPNAFTGTNTYDVNRPTSTLTSTISATDFLTKQNADTLYTGSAGDVQEGGNNVFTGTNKFDVNRPTSTIATTPAATDLITKQNADTLYTNNTGDAVLAGSNAFSGTNTFDVNRPTSTLTSTPASTDFITKANGDALYGGASGDALLAGGTTANPQIFTGVNEFDGTTNSNVGLIEQTATTSNTFIQENGTGGNFIEQSGTNKGHIIQQAINSVIRQNGDDAEILQIGEGARIKQTGATSLIEQTGGTGCLIKTTGHFRTPEAPLVGNDLTNKEYVDTQINDTYPSRNFTFFNQILSVNTANSGYSYISEMEVAVTPRHFNPDGSVASHFKITMNAQYSSQTGARMIYVGCRLYRNFAHLTAASNANTNTTQANAACWVTHNARVNFNTSLHNNQMSGLFIDTDPQVHSDGKIYYSIGIRPVAYNTSSGGANANVFKMNCMYGTSASSVRDPANTSQMLVEEFKVL